MWGDKGSDDWFDRLAFAPRSVLILDYDGTGAPFVRQRMEALLYPGVFERLVELSKCANVRLILSSGRPARELRRLVPSLQVEIWGSNGRERLFADGRYTLQPLTPYQQGALIWLESTLIQRGFSSLIEVKPGSLSLHMRGHSIKVERALTDLIPGLFRELSDQTAVEWLTFDGGLEVRAYGCSSADIINQVLSEQPVGTMAAYLGDDNSDEEAYRALIGRGLPVLVRDEPRETLARLWIRPPRELLEFLDRWLIQTAAAVDRTSGKLA